MQIFVNDLSLNGQFSSVNDFRKVLEPLLALKKKEPLLGHNLLCSRQLNLRYITPSLSFSKAFYNMYDRTFKNIVLNWITKEGPFWDDDRCFNPDDYFEIYGENLTDQGLGEAARRQLQNMVVSTFSFSSSGYDFEIDPITIQHGLAESPLNFIRIQNTWLISQIKELLQNVRPEPQNWKEAIDNAKSLFPELIFEQNHIVEQLKSHPFSQQLAEKIFDRLRILNAVAEETNQDGSLSAHGKFLHENHFCGEKAWFTDESSKNKNHYKRELTFTDPIDSNNSLFCSWHGKIKTPQFRVHLEWPRPTGQ